MQTMNEVQRQRYLRALGLTPWVARESLPGAAPSEVLDWDNEAGTVESADAAPPSSAAAVEATPVNPLPDVEKMDSASTHVAAVETSAPTAPAGQITQPIFTLEAHLAGDTWVVFQQEDAQAPGLGRHTGALAASLLAVFSATAERPRRFYCPLTTQPMNAEEAAQALSAFFTGLVQRQGGKRALFCVEADLAAQVLGGERYRMVRLGEIPVLTVDSLAEMLAQPAVSKKRSWQAMVEHGFTGSR